MEFDDGVLREPVHGEGVVCDRGIDLGPIAVSEDHAAHTRLAPPGRQKQSGFVLFVQLSVMRAQSSVDVGKVSNIIQEDQKHGSSLPHFTSCADEPTGGLHQSDGRSTGLVPVEEDQMPKTWTLSRGVDQPVRSDRKQPVAKIRRCRCPARRRDLLPRCDRIGNREPHVWRISARASC